MNYGAVYKYNSLHAAFFSMMVNAVRSFVQRSKGCLMRATCPLQPPYWRLYLFMLFVCAVDPYSDDLSMYRIDSFLSSKHAFPPSGNDMIAAPYGDTLIPCSGITSMNNDELILRRRFSATDYGLYRGKKNTKGFKRLCAFNPPPDMTTALLVHKKLYFKISDNANMDIADIYFDNECIYAENTVTLYYHDQSWHSVTMQKPYPSTLVIQTNPPQATVSIDGVIRGKTPLELSDLLSPYVILQVKKEHYYQRDLFVSLEGYPQRIVTINLHKMITPVQGVYISPDTYTAETPCSIRELYEQIERLQEKLRMEQEQNRMKIAQFEQQYPELPAQGEFEKTADYLQKKELHEKRKQRGTMAILVNSAPRINTIEKALEKLLAYRVMLENRLYHCYFATQTIPLHRYEPDAEYFPLSFHIDDQGHTFQFNGTVRVPIYYAPMFKQSFDSARLRITYRNRIFKQENAAAKILYEYIQLAIILKGKEYIMEGNCRFPQQGESDRFPVAGRTGKEPLFDSGETP